MTDRDEATLVDIDEVDSGKVSQGGQLFVGNDYAGKQVKYAIRVEEGDESAESDTEDTED